MTETIDEAPRSAVPRHFWIVAIVSLLWNAFGGVDYTMSHLQGEAWYRQMGMTETMIAGINAYPTWMHAVWAIGVWGSVAGSILLLVRSRWAFHAFALSSLGAIGSLIYQAMNPVEGMGLVMPAVIVAIVLFFTWYAQWMTKRGVLR
ncbi:hypothetical protein [Phenylobacterium sp.]|jgi:hypothetical protein|uniref:hypothetical protein n=1 Tax=Phenylobacterium sp. TaxID=1871053 RepID=UPI002F938B13